MLVNFDFTSLYGNVTPLRYIKFRWDRIRKLKSILEKINPSK